MAFLHIVSPSNSLVLFWPINWIKSDRTIFGTFYFRRQKSLFLFEILDLTLEWSSELTFWSKSRSLSNTLVHILKLLSELLVGELVTRNFIWSVHLTEIVFYEDWSIKSVKMITVIMLSHFINIKLACWPHSLLQVS